MRSWTLAEEVSEEVRILVGVIGADLDAWSQEYTEIVIDPMTAILFGGSEEAHDRRPRRAKHR